VGGRGRCEFAEKTLEGLLAEFVFGSKLCSNSMKKKEHILNSSVTVTLSCSSHSSAWDRSRKGLHKTASLFRSQAVCLHTAATDTPFHDLLQPTPHIL
jgi:hypothetical protein